MCIRDRGRQDHLAGEVKARKVLNRTGVDPLIGLGLAGAEIGGVAQEDHLIGGAFSLSLIHI